MEVQVYRHEQDTRLEKKAVAEDVHTVYAEQEHAIEINVVMEEDQPMVDVSVEVVGKENVVTSEVGVVILDFNKIIHS